jgi:hypothetical protein
VPDLPKANRPTHPTPGGPSALNDVPLSRTAGSPNFGIRSLNYNPPRAPDLTECESCGGAVPPRPAQPWKAFYRSMPAKRFCSERCRKREEAKRARQRKREARDA